jgi:hypothetical protein
MRNPIDSYFEFMRNIGMLSYNGSLRDWVVAVILPSLAVTAVVMLLFEIIVRVNR